jgi:competence protein ComEC
MFLISFWERNPALLYALAILVGYSLAFTGKLILIIPLFFLLTDWKKSSIVIGLSLLSFLFIHYNYEFPNIPQEGWRGSASFDIGSLASKSTPYGAQWCYNGKLSMNGHKNIPCTVTFPKKEEIERPLANQSYLINGRLKQNKKGNYSFIADKKTPWTPLKGSWSAAEMRFRAKKAVTDYIHKHINDERSADFLSGLATGTFDDPAMFTEFARFGLQHIMAISGFHFAIIASILAMLLRFIIPERLSTPLLILLLSSYFFFLGDSPSIIRAWITILIALIAITIERRSFGLNSLGAAILFILIYDPLMSQSIGFQFSVLSTAAILLFYPIFNDITQKIFIRRPLSQMSEMDWVNQHGYTILATFRQAMALGLAVNVVAFPAMLFYFQKFPALSLLFNLFFPFLVSISMLLLIIGLLLGPFGGMIHAINNIYTRFTLNFLYGTPSKFDYTLHMDGIPMEFLIIYLAALFVGGIWMQHKLQENKLEFDII